MKRVRVVQEPDHLRRRLAREQRARETAERLLEEKACALYEAKLDLEMVGEHLRSRVEDLQKERERVAHMARTDCLTGLLNRSAFVEDATQRLAALAPGSTLAMFSVDLDRFKFVNDTYGHAAGDVTLRAAAQRLAELFGPRAAVARFGGDEFVALLTLEGGRSEAEALGAAALAQLSAPIDYEGAALRVGGSIGVALAPQDANDLSCLLRRADLALYQAKARGRGRAVSFDQRFYEDVRMRRELRRRLERGIADGEIEAWFQPIIDARRPRRRKVEILARWRDKERGALVQPDAFVPIAEEAGLIGALDAAVLCAAREPLNEWFAAGIIDAASCNISMSEFQERDFADRFVESLRDHDFGRGRIVAEITETVAVDDPGLARIHIGSLARAGVRVALDDFGAGFSNLRALADLPVASLKLDRSLLSEVANEPRLGAFFSAAVSLGRALGLHVVAEGVETVHQADFARAAGCDDLQGYLFARPLNAEDCGAWLRSSGA